MEPRISCITLGVADLTRSIGFYRNLGFPTDVEEGAPIAFFTTGGTRLALYPLDRLAEYVEGSVPARPGGSLPFNGITLGHNVRTKEEVAAVLDLAQTAGGKILKPAEDVFWGGHSGVFADPDGYMWEVAWAPMFRLDEGGTLHFE